MTVYDGRIQLFALTAGQWAAANPVLMLGEIGAQDVGSSTPVLKIGDGVRPYSTLPNLLAPVVAANDYVAGPVTTLPPGSSAAVIIDNTVDPPSISFGIPAGATGPANSLSIGTVTASAPGAPAGATIAGTPPNQVLSLVIPRGDPGPKGDKGDKGDPGAIALANPTALVGLAAINGVSAFAMRSDAAPAINLAIAPTWTGAHTFTQPATFSGVGGGNQVVLNNPAAGLNLKNVILRQDSVGNIVLASSTDAVPTTGITNAFIFQRSGTAWSNFMFGNATDNPTYNFLGNGMARFNGQVRGQGSGKFVGWNNQINADVAGTGVEIGAISGTCWIQAYPSLNVDSSQIALMTNGVARVSIAAGGVVDFPGGDVRLCGRGALIDLNDGYLRLNSGSHYANGVYTPGLLYSGSWLKSSFGVANDNASKQLSFGTTSYGTISVYGALGGYHGYQINDGALYPSFLSDGTAVGILLYDGAWKWLLVRSDPSNVSISYAVTAYAFTAPTFNVSSSRALKRETGAPSAERVRDVLSRLRVVLYRLLTDPEAEHIGGIAEEVHEVCPWLSHDGKTIAMDRLAWLLLADWQATHGAAS